MEGGEKEGSGRRGEGGRGREGEGGGGREGVRRRKAGRREGEEGREWKGER